MQNEYLTPFRNKINIVCWHEIVSLLYLRSKTFITTDSITWFYLLQIKKRLRIQLARISSKLLLVWLKLGSVMAAWNSGSRADSAGFRIVSDNSIVIQNMLIQRLILDETEILKWNRHKNSHIFLNNSRSPVLKIDKNYQNAYDISKMRMWSVSRSG